MPSRRCLYITVPTSLIDDEKISDECCRRHLRLLKRAWEETETRYEHATLSNAELAELWHLSEEHSRKALAEMRKLGLVETKQHGRTQRVLNILVAWRGQRMDSLPEGEIAGLASRPNAPEPQQALRPVSAPAPATNVPTRRRKKPLSNIMEGGRGTPTLESLPNSTAAAVSSTSVLGISEQQQQINADARTHERVFELLDELGIEEPVLSELAHLPHISEAFLAPWADHARGNPKLGPGYYVLRIRRRTLAPQDNRRRVKDQIDRLAATSWVVAETGNDGAGAATPGIDREAALLWQAAKVELELQMTKATFETWVRSSSGLGLAEGVLVVGVQSEYAKEWLEQRLHTTIQRTLVGITGKPTEVRYQVRNASSKRIGGRK